MSKTSSFTRSRATDDSITVIGGQVNVNAVTEQTNNVVQDYALVIFLAAKAR